MNHASDIASDASATAVRPGAPGHRSTSVDAKTVLVSVATFDWLRRLQAQAPQPRMDMRYLVDGATAALTDRTELQLDWIEAATAALAVHVNQRYANAATRPSAATGTVLAQQGEGATARTAGMLHHGKRRHEDCRALQIGVPSYRRLCSVQEQTYEPRLDFRFLLTGAHELLAQRPQILPEVIARARIALRDHLTELTANPVAPFSMEIER